MHLYMYMMACSSFPNLYPFLMIKFCVCLFQMLLHLKDFSQKMMSRTHEIEKQVDTLMQETKVQPHRYHSNVFDCDSFKLQVCLGFNSIHAFCIM